MRPRDSQKQLVIRDLTSSWRRHRQTAKRSSSGSSGAYPGSEALLGDEGASGRGDRSSLPPEWVDYADTAQEEISQIREQIVKLTKAHQRRLLSVMDNSPDKDVEAISSNISAMIRRCEQSIHQIRAQRKPKEGLLDDEFRQNMQRNLASQLQQLSRQCREIQKEFIAELKRRKGQETALEDSAGVPASSSLAGQQAMQQQLAELDDMEALAANRSGEIAQIASSVTELNRIFKDLAALVIDQGTILDRIDFNTEKIYEKSDEAKGQIQKAVKRKKENDSRAWKCLLVWGAADIVLLLVLLVKYQLKYGLKNVLIFIVVVGLIIAGCFFGVKLLCPKAQKEGPEYFEKMLPEGYRPNDLWKKMRPGPINSAKMGAAAMSGGGGLPV